MLVKFDHILGFGKMTNQDFVYSNPQGILEEKELPDDALENGWIPWKGAWYNHRSVRINVDQYYPSKSTKKDLSKIELEFKSIQKFNDHKLVEEMYNTYCKKNNFILTTSIKDIITEANCFFRFKKDGIIKGYTFSILNERSLVSLEFIQNFECSNISLGSISQHHECKVAKSLGKKYVYILGGYETACLYKCNFHGMEWWTGKDWSNDLFLYKKLCQRDSNIIIYNYDNNL